MKNLMIGAILVLFVLPVAFATDLLKDNFLAACDASPHVDEGSNCMCFYNEVIHEFGEEDARELIPFISGEQEMEKEVGESLSFIVGKCEDE